MSNWPNWNLVESSRRSAMSIVNSKPPNLIRELDYSYSTFLGTFLLLFSTHEKFQLSQQKLDLRSICFVNNEIFTPVNALGSCVVFWNIRNETFANCNRLAIEPFKWNSIFRRIKTLKISKTNAQENTITVNCARYELNAFIFRSKLNCVLQ